MTSPIADIRKQISRMSKDEAVEHLLSVIDYYLDEDDGIGIFENIALSPVRRAIFRRLYLARVVVVNSSAIAAVVEARNSSVIDDRAVKVHICHIRKKLVGTGAHIDNVWGSGYRFERDPGVIFPWETRYPAAVGG